mmetsp:Transcript_23455/g.61435  ORF Transcript_23455/g.61435 Transcript_23455/m.61435 type:complete len:471 (+) Transcript_23455:279-1691(+)
MSSPTARRDSLFFADGDGGEGQAAAAAAPVTVDAANDDGDDGDDGASEGTTGLPSRRLVPRKDSILRADYRAPSVDLGVPPAASEYAGATAPMKGDADWVEEYGFVGENDGRRLATMARKATRANPWRKVQNQSVRLKTVPTADVVQVLDSEARHRAWYCLDMGRENAVAMLENLQDMLPDGTFVVSNSRREFAMLTYLHKKNLTTVALDADVGGVWLKAPGTKKPPRFKTLSALVGHYAAKKQRGLLCKLQTSVLEKTLDEVTASGWLPDDDDADAEGHGGRGGAMTNPGYYRAPRDGGGMHNPGYQGGALVPSPTGYELIEVDSEGFIQISKSSFQVDDGIYGVTFQPCQNDQWFFMGLSNIHQNHHGRRDCHYDDIDFCISVMGHGKATARENEDEVGPYIDYKARDTFTIRVNLKKKSVEYTKNKKVFYSSVLSDDKLPLWALQAFHPINGGQLLIQNSNWLYKFK